MKNNTIEDKESIRQFTEKYEGSGGAVGRRLIENFFNTVISLIPDDAQSAVEIGCGAGYSTEHIHSAKPSLKLSASDVDPELTELTLGRVHDVQCTTESIYALNRDSESTDLTFTLEVFEHLEEPEKALREIHRVTRRYAIISVPHEPIWRILNMARGKYLSDFGNTPGHLNHWTTTGLKKFVSPLFTICAVRTPLPWTVLLLEKRHTTHDESNL